MATPTNPTRPKSGKKSPTGGVGGMDSGILVKIAWDINQAVESGKKLEKSVKDIAVETSKTTKSIEAQLTKMTAVFTQSVEGMAGKFDSALEKIDKKLQSAATRSAKKVRDTVKQASDDVKHLAEEGAKATEANDATVDKASENTRKNLKETDKEVNKVRDSFNSLGNIIKKIGSGIGPALAQGLTASFSFFFGMLNRLKEYDTFLGQLHTKITNTSKELSAYQETLLNQTVVGKNELSFGLTPEQRREAMGTFATFASEQEKYGAKTAANIKGLTEGAAGMLKGIGIPIGEASALLMDLHRKVGLTYKEMENFSLGMTSLYRRSSMTTDQFKKMLDILPSIARSYGMSTKAAKEFTEQSSAVGVAMDRVGLNAEQMLAKMNMAAEGSEEGLIQSMILGLNPNDVEGNKTKFVQQAQKVYNDTGGENASAADIRMRRLYADAYGLKNFSMEEINTMGGKGVFTETDKGSTQKSVEQNFEETAKALKDVSLKLERPFVTMDQQISQFFAEAEARIVRKFSGAVQDFKDIMGALGKKLASLAGWLDMLTGGGGLGLGKLAGAALIAGLIVGPLVSGIVRAITTAFSIERLGGWILRGLGMGRFATMFAGTAGGVAGTGGIAAGGVAAMASTVGAVLLTFAASYAFGSVLNIAFHAMKDKLTGRWEKFDQSKKDLDEVDKFKAAVSNVTKFEDKQELYQTLKSLIINPEEKARLTGRLDIADKLFGKNDKELVEIRKALEDALSKHNKQFANEIRAFAVKRDKGETATAIESFVKEQELKLRGSIEEVNERLSGKIVKDGLTDKQLEIKGYVEEGAKLRGIDPKYASGLAFVEGTYTNEPNKSEGSTAKGFFQVTDPTFKTWTKKEGGVQSYEDSMEALEEGTKRYAKKYGIDTADISLKDAQLLSTAWMNDKSLSTGDWNVKWKDKEGKDKSRNISEEVTNRLKKFASMPEYAGQEGFENLDELVKYAQQKRAEESGRFLARENKVKSTTPEAKVASAAMEAVKETKQTPDIKAVQQGKKYNLSVWNDGTLVEGKGTTASQIGQDTTPIAKAAEASSVKDENLGKMHIVEHDPKLATPAKPVTSAIEKPALPTKVEDSAAVKNVHDTATYQVLTRIESLLRETQNTKPADIDIFQSKNDWRFYQQNANNSLAGVTS